MTPEGFAKAIDDAASELDKVRAKKLCDELVASLPEQDAPFPVKPAKSILFSLRRKRYFDLMCQVADALISNGQRDAQIRRQYAQALIDSGQLSAALAVLEGIAGDLLSPLAEVAEARGLIGRVHKQFYVNNENATQMRKQGTLEAAIRSYKQVYDSNPDQYLWHGINVVALLARADRDGLAVPSDENFGDTATRISKTIEEMDNDKGRVATQWDFATAMEAAVALGDVRSATKWAERYVAEEPDAFELASTLRQLEEVWDVTPQDKMGQEIVPLLKAALLKAEGGCIEMSRSEYSGLKGNAGDMQLERVFGRDSYRRIEWLRLALESCQAIGQVTTRTGKAVGTGFVVKGKSLSLRLDDDWYFLTNSHVITDDEEVIRNSDQGRRPLKPEQAYITFQLLFEQEPLEFQVQELTWTSPPNVLDATLLRLNRPFYEGKVESYQITSDLPDPKERKRIYIAGHPGGGGLTVSLHDNLLLEYDERLMQYRTPTDPGSSGSPVFNDEWELVGLHHAGSSKKQSLSDPSREHEANEGIRMSAIMKAIQDTDQIP